MGKNISQVDPKCRLGSSVQQQQITANKEREKSSKTARLMAYIDNTPWWWLMSLQHFLSNLCRLSEMKVSSHSLGGRGKNKTAVPGKPPKTQAFFCVTRLPLTFLEVHLQWAMERDLRRAWCPAQTHPNHLWRATDARQPLIAMGVWLIAFHV